MPKLVDHAICFDDVQILPRVSSVSSRSEVNLTSIDTIMKPNMPVFAAPMRSVVDENNYDTFLEGGVQPILPYTGQATKAKYVSVRLKDISLLENPNLELKLACLDLASAYVMGSRLKQDINRFRSICEERGIKTMIGNVATQTGFMVCSNFDFVRVGIGGGSACTTRMVTGIGCPTLYSVQEAYQASLYLHNEPPKIVADGGIRGPADAFKALLFGADYVMLGGFFGGCVDSPGAFDGMVPFFGEASSVAKNNKHYVEGAHGLVKTEGSVLERCVSLKEGLQSAFSYVGCGDLDVFRKERDRIDYVKVSPAALSENKPHKFL